MKKSKIDSFLDSGIENMLYWISLFVVALVAVMYMLHVWFVNYTGRYELLECRLMAMTGIPCPGCGGTRSIKSLLRGDIVSSLYYNAFVTYSAIVYGIFFVSNMRIAFVFISFCFAIKFFNLLFFQLFPYP